MVWIHFNPTLRAFNFNEFCMNPVLLLNSEALEDSNFVSVILVSMASPKKISLKGNRHYLWKLI